jgi:hypothetical protein
MRGARVTNGDPGSRRRVVAVVGAGRSGTSAIARAVQAVGVDLGDRLRRGRGKNPTGFFEDRHLRAITNRLKRALGIRGPSVRLLAPPEFETPAVRALRAEAVDTIRRRFGACRVWGFKHGRTLRLLPFWLAVFGDLGLESGYVVAIRNPLSVARSRARLDVRRGEQAKSDLEWLVSIVPHLRLVRDRPIVVIDYDLLMAAPLAQLERLAARLGMPVTEETRASFGVFATDFLAPEIRHSHFTAEDLSRAPDINPLVRDAYRWLHRLATDAIDQRDAGLWQEWQRFEDALAALGPILDYVDRVEEDARRARASLLGPLQAVPEVWRKLRGY